MTFDEWFSDWTKDTPSWRTSKPVREGLRIAWDAAVAAERERCKRIVQLNQCRNGHHTHDCTTIGHYDVRMIAEIESGLPPKA